MQKNPPNNVLVLKFGWCVHHGLRKYFTFQILDINDVTSFLCIGYQISAKSSQPGQDGAVCEGTVILTAICWLLSGVYSGHLEAVVYCTMGTKR